MGRCEIVAEIGQNHQGDIGTALELVRAAAAAGATAVKGQKRDLAGHPEWDRPYDGPHSFGKTYREHRAVLELTWEQHADLAVSAARLGLDYYVSVWDLPSAEGALARFDTIKIPSALAAHWPLLAAIRGRNEEHGARVVLSTGGLTLVQVRRAVQVVAPDTLLQCTMAYPAAPEATHLRVMETYRAEFPGLRVGFSSHARGLHIEEAAAALGADLIEVHLTLDRTMKGRDHAASKEPGMLAKLVRNVRQIEVALGSAVKAVLPCEAEAVARLRR